jgi:acyl transferase domain-containing protein
MTETRYDSAVAIIGMSGRFPGADNVLELWRNLVEGQTGLRQVSDEELTAVGVDPALTAHPRYVRVAGPVADIDMFDAAFFGFTPSEAEIADPQHRLFLECSWEALEGAGYLPTAVPGQVGVFAGCGFPNYMTHHVIHLANEPGGMLQLAVGNERDSLASLVAYKLDLRGPSIGVQTFCSTSLVAVHLASQSLLTFECDVALAGGAYIDLPQPAGYLFEEGGIASPDGVVHSFDAAAHGTVMGNGVGVVALKRMNDALADGDQIHAVILGSSTNNDGRARVGYTAPGVDGQAEVIESALGVAGAEPETVGYVECHATGTMLGDSIELAAMARVFRRGSGGRCVLGSLKPSIGHLDRASGVAGLIRAAMALRHQVLPGTPNFRTPNEALAAAEDRFQVLTTSRSWPSGHGPRRAGVSSFGLGGTNAHVVLEEAPEPATAAHRPGPHLLVLSARTEEALDVATNELRRYLDLHDELDIADVAFTLQQSRTGFAVRRAVVCRDKNDAVAALKDRSRWTNGEARYDNPLVTLRIPDAEALTHEQWHELRVGVASVVGLAPDAASASSDTDAAHVTAARVLIDSLGKVGVQVVQTRDDKAGAATVNRKQAQQPTVSVSPPSQDDPPGPEWFLRQLALLWQSGVKPDWAALHQGRPHRVSLPTYPFQRRRYWVAAARHEQRQRDPATGGRAMDPTQWTYAASWRRRPLLVASLGDRLRTAGHWLVFVADSCGETVVRLLAEAGARVTVVRPGDGFAKVGPDEFRVRPDSVRDYQLLLGQRGVNPRTVLHGFSLTAQPRDSSACSPSQRFDQEQAHGFHAVLALVAALSGRTDPQPVDLVILSDGAVGVTGSDLTHPEHATLAGLAPTIAQENPGISCRHIDVDARSAESRSALGRLATHVLCDAVSEHVGPVALRHGERWVRGYDALPLPVPALDDRAIRDGATVLITGGLGDVGLVIARHLASTRRCRLVLTARSPLPPREEWAQRLADRAEPQGRTTRHIRAVLALEQRGAEVMAVGADAADEEQMHDVVRMTTSRFGPVDAVVHGAGVSDPSYFGTAHELDRAACDAHFRAKVHGFHVLQQSLDGSRMTHQITLSSLSAILGGITLGPYAAANSALDAYALDARAHGERQWLTVDWDTWRVRPDQQETPNGGVADFGMTPSEGLDVFERALHAASVTGQLVISTGSLEARLAQWVIGPVAGDTAAGPDDSDSRRCDPRPVLATPYVQPENEVEEALCGVWSSVLGLDRVGAEDNFFELGGHSLVAMQLMSRVRQQVKGSAPVTAVLEHPTVRQLATVLRFENKQPDREED